MKILYLGQLWYGSTALYRLNALKELGYQVDFIDSTKNIDSFKGYCYRAANKFNYDLDINGDNDLLIKKNIENIYDIIWLDKCTHIKSATLFKIKKENPQVIILGYSPDDMMNRANQSYQYLKGIPFYDVHVTTKSFNVDELRGLGAKNVFYSKKAFDPLVHKTYELTQEEIKEYSTPIGFIGTYENDRFFQMLELVESINSKITVRGDKKWTKKKNIHPNLDVKADYRLWGHEYAKAIGVTKINLCFLRKANRDLHTARSIEIPACGGFMLAERTIEHLELFEEGKEAEFFSSTDELIEKVKYYLLHEKERLAIAEAGRSRCLNSGYSNQDRLKEIINYLMSFNYDK